MHAGAHPSAPAAAGSSLTRLRSAAAAPPFAVIFLRVPAARLLHLHRSSSSPPLPIAGPPPPIDLVSAAPYRRSSSSAGRARPRRSSSARAPLLSLPLATHRNVGAPPRIWEREKIRGFPRSPSRHDRCACRIRALLKALQCPRQRALCTYRM
jgi:hypothetical protein